MKKRAMKNLISMTCLVLAMCMAFQTTALAVEVPVDEPAAASTADEPDSSAASSSEASEPEEEEEPKQDEPAADEPEKDPADSAEGDSSAVPGDGSEQVPEKDPADDPNGTIGDQSTEDPAVDPAEDPTVEPEDPADVDPMAGTDNGWVQATNADGATYWTFYYWENTAASTSTQAKGEVIYLPEDVTVGQYTFKKGCYYFTSAGALVTDASKTSVGPLEVLKKDSASGKYLSDPSHADAGKMVQVTVKTAESQGNVTLTPTVGYYTGSYSKVYYSKGEPYTGFYINPDTGILYYMTDGVYERYTGKYDKSNKDTYGDTVFTGDDLWYYNGKVFTGYVRRTSSDYVWDVKSGKGGTKLTGVMSTGKKYLRVDTKKVGKGDGKRYKNGKVFTGGYDDGYYYQKGVKKTDYKGWKTFDDSGNSSSQSSDNTYYFGSNGKYYTGWHTLTRNSNKYKFYFNSDGTLCKNIYKKYSSYKKKPTKIVVSRGTHTATMYAKNGNSYNLPCKSFVISTSKKSENFKPGTYSISRRQAWFKIDGVRWWYKWASYISGSGSWFHSEQYYEKGNHKSLNNNSYNGLGTNQSKQCIRTQVVNSKLVYDMKGNGAIKQVVLNQSSNKGPFGKMTLSDNVDHIGKLPKDKRGYDPTDPKRNS